MKRRLNIFLSAFLTFVMVFLYSAQPHVVYATTNTTTNQDKEITSPTAGGEIAPEAVVEPEVVIALAPVAAYAFSSTVVNSIFAVTLGWFVGSSSQSLFQGSVNDKLYTSTAQYTVTTVPEYYTSFPEYIGTTQVTNSAGKHMPKEVVQELHYRIKNYSNEYNYRVYHSTEIPGNTMYVIDINSQLNSLVNRHLGNHIGGLTGYNTEDPSFGNETLDLAGYSIFILTSRYDQKVFHAHFTPQYLRNREVEFNRYRGQFNLQTYPVRTRNDKYLKVTDGYAASFSAAKNNRGLLFDTKGNPAVVPYK